jgi:hypothetical protein
MAYTKPGESFLKDAFAPPDFATLEVYGVPDKYVGKTITKQHFYNATINTNNDKDLVVIVCPTPGQAIFANSQIAPGDGGNELEYGGQQFLDAPLDFGTNQNEATNFQRFRCVALSAELVSLGNPLTTQGGITVVKAPLSITGNPGASGLVYEVSGSESIAASLLRAEYTKPLAEGAYSVATHEQPDWEFTKVITGLSTVSGDAGAGDTFKLLSYSATNPGSGPGIVGMGDHDSIIFRVVGTGSESVPINIRVWATYEYQVQPASNLYSFAHASPGEDELAMCNYRKMAQSLPPAVPSKQNAGFWNMLTGIVSSVGNFASKLLPGPFGAIAGGIGAAAGMIHQATA